MKKYNAKHTPGPWVAMQTVSPKEDDELRFYTRVEQGSNRLTSICNAYGWTEEETISNAALIAAAPDMAEVVKWVVERCGHAYDVRTLDDAKMVEKARTALAKAGMK